MVDVTEPRTNADQEQFWDTDAGPIWVRNMQAMDVCLAPILDLVLQKAALKSGEDILDIGCGAGTSTFAAAHLVGADGTALGADISTTLLAFAEARKEAPNARFVYSDAEKYAFTPDSVDVLISRFGVMFFENPTEAFRNMARAVRSGGRMVFAAWGQIPTNPFFILPAGVAKTCIGPTPRTNPDAPGPFSFRDTDKVCALLSDAGWQDVEGAVEDIMLTPKGGPEGFAELALQIGPAHRTLGHYEASLAERDKLRTAIAEAAQIYLAHGKMHIPAEINLFSAQKR